MSRVARVNAIVWLRRDLRRADLPLLSAAHERAAGGEVAICFVLDPAFFDGAGRTRRAWLATTLVACALVALALGNVNVAGNIVLSILGALTCMNLSPE